MRNFYSQQRMIIKPDTSVVDVALNLSGSLAGLPVVLSQLPFGERVGFDTLPKPDEEVLDVGQSWTPHLVGLDLDLIAPLYNAQAARKQPYFTDLAKVQRAVDFGNEYLRETVPPLPPLSLANVPVGFELTGKIIYFRDRHKPCITTIESSLIQIRRVDNPTFNGYIKFMPSIFWFYWLYTTYQSWYITPCADSVWSCAYVTFRVIPNTAPTPYAGFPWVVTANPFLGMTFDPAVWSPADALILDDIPANP